MTAAAHRWVSRPLLGVIMGIGSIHICRIYGEVLRRATTCSSFSGGDRFNMHIGAIGRVRDLGSSVRISARDLVSPLPRATIAERSWRRNGGIIPRLPGTLLIIADCRCRWRRRLGWC